MTNKKAKAKVVYDDETRTAKVYGERQLCLSIFGSIFYKFKPKWRMIGRLLFDSEGTVVYKVRTLWDFIQFTTDHINIMSRVIREFKKRYSDE